MPYSRATASKIRACIRANPGLRAKDIGQRVGLRRETVNSYLYSKRPGALGQEVFQDSNYGWHLKESVPLDPNITTLSPQLSRPHSNRSIPTTIPTSPSAEKLDREDVLVLTLVEAFQGAVKDVMFAGEPLSVRVPPGARPGIKLRVQGKGYYSTDRSRRGDLLLRIETRSDEFLHLEGDDLVCQVVLSSEVTARGGQVQVPTLEGTVAVKIPPGIKSGQKLCLTGKGWKNTLGDRGNQLIKVVILPAQENVAAPEPKVPPQYSAETIQQVFHRDDYSALSDDEQGKLAQMLEEAERERQRLAQLPPDKPRALVLRSGWFWVAVLLGGVVTFAVIQSVPHLNPLPPAPVQNNR